MPLMPISDTIRVVAQPFTPRRRMANELIRFLGVGSAATILTVVLFNVFVHIGRAPLAEAPATAYAIAFVIGTGFAFAGNRLWAFRHRRSSNPVRDFTAFAFLNAIGLTIPVMMLLLSRHVLRLDSFWADNIAANVVGLVLATSFRFWSYRRWVFRS